MKGSAEAQIGSIVRTVSGGMVAGMHGAGLTPLLAVVVLALLAGDGSADFTPTNGVENMVPGQSYSKFIQADVIHSYAFTLDSASFDAGANFQLALSVIDGDPDVYVNPPGEVMPLPDSAVWKSHHGSGDDIVWVSHLHPKYAEGKFLVSVVGFSPVAQYELRLDVVSVPPYNVPEEAAAFKAIFDKCCDPEDNVTTCMAWHEHGGRDADPCHMVGSICDASGKVTRLELSRNGLNCTLPAELGVFSGVKAIYLDDNAFKGTWEDVESIASYMPDLERLFVHINEISGTLSCLPQNTKLTALSVTALQLTGAIPECLVRKPSLREFYAASNDFSGPLPTDWTPVDGSTPGLDIVSIPFQGTEDGGSLLRNTPFPTTLLSLPRLYYLDFRGNGLTGTLPPSVTGALRQASVEGNALHGQVPTGFASLPDLTYLGLSWNAFSGPLPTTWSATSLTRLSIMNNRLTGSIPVSLGALPALSVVTLSNNSLSGHLPAVSPGSWPNVRVFNVSMNGISGTLQDSLQSMPAFSPVAEPVRPGFVRRQVFDVSHNQITGAVPEFMKNETLLRMRHVNVRLGGNNLLCPGDAQSQALLNAEVGLTCVGTIDSGRPPLDGDLTGEGAVFDAPNGDGNNSGGIGTVNVVIIVFVCCGVLIACFGTYVIFLRYGPWRQQQNFAHLHDNPAAGQEPGIHRGAGDVGMHGTFHMDLVDSDSPGADARTGGGRGERGGGPPVVTVGEALA